MTDTEQNWTENARRDAVPADDRGIPVIVACRVDAPKGNVLLVHGRNGAPDQAQIAEIAVAHLARGWRVVAPELPHSAALPGSGAADRVTFSGHVAAADAAWSWVAEQWPGIPRALAGHSIGAYAIAHLAAGSQDAHHVLAVSPALSGRALLAARQAMGPAAVAEVTREVPLFRAEMETADATPALAQVGAPLAVVTGAEDGLVPLAHAHAYFSAAKTPRFFAALPGQHHCPAGADCAAMLAAALLALDA